MSTLSHRAFIAVLGLGTVLSGLSVAFAAPGPVPDGVYTLMKISGDSLINLGELEIKGKTYRIVGDKEFAPYTIDGKGVITWSKGLSFLPDNWKHEASNYAGSDSKGRPLIKIEYRSARGTLDLIDALKEK